MRTFYTHFLLLLSLLLFVPLLTYAQCGASYCGTNLVQNADFEKTQNPQCAGNGQDNQLWVDSSPLPRWFGTSCKTCQGNGITPDNFNSGCGGNSTFTCDQSKGSVGFYTYTGSGDIREHVQAKLLAPLKAGKKYCVEMDVKNGGGAKPCDGLGVYFSNKIYDLDKDNGGNSFFAFTPQVEQPKGVKIDACTKFSQSFCAKGGETCIMIGNFRTDANTTIESGGFATMGYLVIDNVSIREVCEPNPLQLSLTASPAAIMCGNSSTLTLTATGGNGGYTYLWLNPSGSSGQGPVTVTPATTTTYSVAVTTNGNCGKYTDTVKVTVNVDCGPVVTATGSTICKDKSASVSASATGGTPPYTFTWNPGNLNGNTQTVTPAATTTYTVIVKDSKGASDTTTAVVTVNQPPVLIVSLNPTVVCIDSTCTVSCSGASSYSWSPSGDTSSNIIVKPITFGDLTYTVTGADAAGCKTSKEVIIPVKDCGPLTITPDSITLCKGTCGTLKAKTKGGVLPFSYTWSSGDTTATIKVCPSIDTTYTVTVKDKKGKTATAVCVVKVNPLPVISASSAVICKGESASVSAAGGNSYQWSNGTTNSSILVSPVSTTSYTVTGTDMKGCSASAVSTVTVNPLPSLTCADITICNDTCGILSAHGADSYLWKPGGEKDSTLLACPKTTTTYTLTGTSKGCSSSKTVKVTVVAKPVISITGPTTICAEQTAKLTASGSLNYKWNTGDTSAVIHVTPTVTAIYTVMAGIGQCTSTGSFKLDVKALPLLNVNNGSICTGDSIDLTVSGADTYEWSTGEKQATIHVNPSKTTTYTVTGVSNGCSKQILSTVTVNPLPVAGFTANPTIVSIENASIVFNNTTTHGSSYHWDFGDDNSSNLETPKHTYSDTGHFEVCLIAYNNGCSDKVCETVVVLPELTFYIPNAFSPNNDGNNDVFTGKGTNIKEFNMWIFDRWGNLIYHSDNLNSPWMGSVDNKPGKENIAQQDVYVWKVQLKDFLNRQRSMTGTVTLIK